MTIDSRRGARRRSGRRVLAVCCAAALAAAPGCAKRDANRGAGEGGAGEGGADAAARPSILLITIDTLRADHLGCFGYSPYDEPVSPSIDRLAAEGARFTQCFAPRAQTMPSLTSMLTGAYPSAHGVLENAQPLSVERRTLFERAAALGYDTAAFLSFLPTTADGNPARGAALLVSGRDTGPGGPRLEAQWQWDANTAMRTIEWIDGRRDDDARPFFAWVHFYDVHQPYSPPAPYDRMFAGGYAGPLLVREGAAQPEFAGIERRLDEAALAGSPLSPEDHAYVLALYDGGIRSTDRHVGAILDALAKRRLAENTIVIVTSDHGEELGDHNAYYYHGNSVYDGALRVPLLVRWPGRIPAGAAIDALAQNVDLAPTLLEWWGEPPAPELEGASLAGIAGGGAGAPPRGAAFAEWQDLIVSVRTPEWKLVSNPRGAHPKKPPYFGRESSGFAIRCEELYRVDEDPGETRERLASVASAGGAEGGAEGGGASTGGSPDGEANEAAAMLRALAAAHRGREGGGAAMTPTESKSITDELRSLGYVGAPADRADVVIGAESCEGRER